MHIACSADARYLPHTATMLHSIFSEHDPQAIVIHFLHLADLDSNSLSKLADFVKISGAHWRPLMISHDEVSSIPVREMYPAVAWLRIFLPDLLPELGKILYLDSDLVVRRPLWPLWHTDISRYGLAAASNPMHEEMWAWPQEIGLDSRADYFNSGVMLINLNWFRANDIPARLIRFATQYPERIHFADQCALNALCYRDRLALHPRWNLLSAYANKGADILDRDEIRAAEADPAIVHFEGDMTRKPWHYRCEHPYAELYRKHRDQTPWPLQELEGKNLINAVKKKLPKSLLSTLRTLTQPLRRP